MEELKPCPFCGSNEIEYKPTHFGGGESHGVMRCLECGCTVPTSEFGKHVKEPYSDWNRRADECDREALLELANDLAYAGENVDNVACIDQTFIESARRIRKAIGEVTDDAPMA